MLQAYNDIHIVRKRLDMNVRSFGLALLLGVASISHAVAAKRVKPNEPTQAHKTAPLKNMENHAMDVERHNEHQEKEHFQRMIHVFEGYIRRLSGDHFSAQDLKELHDAFHALTPAQKELFFKEFSEQKVAEHIIEKLKLLYQQFTPSHQK